MSLDFSPDPITETAMQQFCVEMMKRLDIQRRNEQFCDMILEVGSGDDQARLKAHRIVLCAASPFFYNALNSDMKEKEEGVIRLEETSKAVMEDVLEYLYTGHVDINEENAYCLMAVADYLILPSLKVLSAMVIAQTLSFSNCAMAYYSAIKYRSEELQRGARDFIVANFESVAKSEDFLNLSMEQVEEWISSDEITVKGEEKIFELILRWTERDESRKCNDFLHLLHHVRCVYVSRDYLFKVILSHPLVKENAEALAFILNAMKLAFDGTEQCFFAQSPRNCLKTYEDTIVACGGQHTLCYVPSENKWYELANMLKSHNPIRCAMSVCHVKVYIFGGNVPGDFITGERFESSINQWVHTKVPEPSNYLLQSVASTLQGFLYVIGGRDKDNKEVSTVQRYNPDTHLWQAVAPLSGPRSRVCAVADENYLYAIGGSHGAAEYLDIVERFDPTSNTWEKLPSTLLGRQYASGAAVKQKVFVFGGSIPGLLPEVACEMYDLAENTWVRIESPIPPRSLTSAVTFKGQIFVLVCSKQQGNWNKVSLETYDVDQNQWRQCTEMPFGCHVFYKISRLRILRDVLINCKVVS